MKPASYYDYNQDVIPGKFTDDWNYVTNGSSGNVVTRAWDILSRDWGQASAEDKAQVIAAFMPLKIGKIGGASINQLNRMVQKGQVPRGIKRFDAGRNTKNLPHDEVHFDSGSSLYRNGVWRHNKGHKFTNEQINFLRKNGWSIPE